MTTQADSAPGTTARAVTATICGQTEVGPVRPGNQDAIVVASAVAAVTGTRLTWTGRVLEAGAVVAVVDGMGGYAGGADAAVLAATALAEADPGRAPEDWDAWFEALSGRITRAGRAWDTPEMGATAAVLAIRPAGLVMANVGDCRIYRVAGGRLGRMSIDDRTQDPGSSAVTQALGGSARIDAHVWEQDLKGGTERYVLCTDGVWGALEPAELRGLCASDRAPDRVVDAVVSAIYARRAGDNCSVVVADITSAPVEGVRGRHLAASPVRSVAVETAPAGRGRRAAR